MLQDYIWSLSIWVLFADIKSFNDLKVLFCNIVKASVSGSLMSFKLIPSLEGKITGEKLFG
jgi:hypothetical protein